MQKQPNDIKEYYKINERGSVLPDYSPAEIQYRSERLIELTNAWVIREQPLMELNNVPYSQYDLTNFQCDLAFNPPRQNPGDSRFVTGYVREKDTTITSVIMNMNFQPEFMPFDKKDDEMVNACNIFTAKVKKVLLQTNFRDKLENMIRLMVSRGNVFVNVVKQEKWNVRKLPVGNAHANPNLHEKVSWKTIYEKECDYTDFDTLPNTSIFPMNIRGEDNAKQTRLYTVRHYPVAEMARIYNKNPRWKSVPKTPTMQVPDIVNGIWGDYYLKLPNKDYMEVITMQSEVFNEYQVWLNGVQMYPIQEENGLITGYPLSKVSPDGKFITCKGDYERIPFFYFSKSNPDKNYVKEEELNEVGRLMLLMLRQKTQPSIGNNTNRVIQPNIWNPNMVISDVKKDDLHILKPNDGINQSEFSFYKLLTEDIDNSSVSKSIEGQQAGDMTATQYVDQKKESLKKLGISLDRAIDFLRQIYWKILDNEISYIDQKIKEYKEDGEFTEAYQSFTLEDSIDGKKGTISVNLMDDTSDIDEYKKAQEEADSGLHTRSFYAKPAHLKSIYKRMRDKMYCNVVSLPEGEQQMLLGALFNLLTSYINLGGNAQKINFDYLETIIAENSGFDSTKVFLEEAPYAPQMDMTGENVPQNMNLKQLTAKQPIQ